MAELDDAVHDQITELCELGNAHADAEDLDAALACFRQAWDLLPEPQTQWEAATWLLASMGDMHFLKQDYEKARQTLQMAMHCPDALGNPFIHLRLGQVQLELRNETRAADELMRAYMGAGGEIFEEEDPKYLAFLRTHARIDD